MKDRIAATVKLGAAMSSSWRSSTRKAEAELAKVGSAVRSVRDEQRNVDIGAAFNRGKISTAAQIVKGDLSGVTDAMREVSRQQDLLEKYDPQSVRRAGREYRELTRDAKRLRKEYQESVKPTKKFLMEVERAERKALRAGSAYKKQRDELDRLGSELKDAGVKTSNARAENDRLTRSMDRLQDRYERMQRASERLTRARAAAGKVVRVGAAITAGVGVAGAAVTTANRLTAEQTALASALSVSADTLADWSGIAREMGLDVDDVADLIEEMNNKLGESAGLEEIVPVKESLKILGLTFEQLRQMQPEEQFLAIAKAVKSLGDHSQAVSAADILMGGNANRFFGYLRARKEGVEDLLDQQRNLNMLTDEGRQGAEKYNRSIGRLTTVVGSATKEFSGLVGSAISPFVDRVSVGLADTLQNLHYNIMGVGDAVTFAGRVGAWAALTAGVGGVVALAAKAGRSLWQMGSGVFRLVGGIGRLGKIGKGDAVSGFGAIPVRVVNLPAGGLGDDIGVDSSRKSGGKPRRRGSRNFGRVGKFARRGGRLLGKVAKPVGIALAATELVGAVSSGDSKTIGSSVGNIGGSIAGAAAGAAIGSIVPILGTTVGGIIGGILGGFGGDWFGGKVGQAFAAPKFNPEIPNVSPVTKNMSMAMDVGGITINTQPGQDPEEIALAVQRKLHILQQDQKHLALYDEAD